MLGFWCSKLILLLNKKMTKTKFYDGFLWIFSNLRNSLAILANYCSKDGVRSMFWMSQHLKLYVIYKAVLNLFHIFPFRFLKKKHQKSCMKPILKSVGIVYFKCSLCGLGLARPPQLRQHILQKQCKKIRTRHLNEGKNKIEKRKS